MVLFPVLWAGFIHSFVHIQWVPTRGWGSQGFTHRPGSLITSVEHSGFHRADLTSWWPLRSWTFCVEAGFWESPLAQTLCSDLDTTTYYLVTLGKWLQSLRLAFTACEVVTMEYNPLCCREVLKRLLFEQTLNSSSCDLGVCLGQRRVTFIPSLPTYSREVDLKKSLIRERC